MTDFQKGVYMGDLKRDEVTGKSTIEWASCECGSRAQRKCEVCGKLMCLDHWLVMTMKKVVDDEKHYDRTTYVVVCDKCKKNGGKVSE